MSVHIDLTLTPDMDESTIVGLIADELDIESGDFGIGAYEHFGSCGVDHEYGTVINTDIIRANVTAFADQGEHDGPEVPTYMEGTVGEYDAEFSLDLEEITTMHIHHSKDDTWSMDQRIARYRVTAK